MRFLFLFCFLLISNLILSQKPNDSIYIEKTPCFGKCPVFKLTLKGTGEIFLKVDTNLTLPRGTYTSNLDLIRTREIFEDFKTQKIFSFKNEYLGKMTDFPTTYLIFKRGKKIKKIKNQYGAPPELKNLEGLLVNLISEIDNWKRVKGE